MGISTNKFLNQILFFLGKISGGKLKTILIDLLYRFYKIFPPAQVIQSREYFNSHREDIETVKKLLADDKSKEVFLKMISFRSTYDMKYHPDYSLDDIYFVKNIITLDDNEVFVDCGAYDGDTIKKFINNTENYKRIIAFEPDPQNFKKLKLFSNGNLKINIRNSGVWSCKDSLRFKAEGLETSKVIQQNETQENDLTEIMVENIDSVEECKDATYIKMDIEGSEYAALLGAKDTILRNKPKLAISIYHKDEDMLKLPIYIYSLVPEYKMYVRQHSHSFFDTVLYCVL